jgi:hypothetical protein
MLQDKAAILLLELRTEVAAPCPVKSAFALVKAGNFIILDQGCRLFDSFQSVDGKGIRVILAFMAITGCKNSGHSKLLSPL